MNIQDRLEIEDLLNRYAFLLDEMRNDRVAAEIFAEDAVIDYGTGEIVGREAINGFFTGFAGEVAATSHCYSNFIIELSGDTARAHSHVVAWHWLHRPDRTVADPADITIAGASQDQLRRTSEGWRISYRTALQYGVAVGTASPGIRALMEGMAHKRASWPE